MLPERIAAALDLRVGDTVHKSINSDRYGGFWTPMEVVGIVSGDVCVGFVPYEYLANHDLYAVSESAIVVAQGFDVFEPMGVFWMLSRLDPVTIIGKKL